MDTYINIHCHQSSQNQSLEIINPDNPEDINANGYFSYGLHPWDPDKKEIVLPQLEFLLLKGKIIAVGEIGVDRAIHTPIDQQKELFIKQHQLAEQYHLPIIIHCVRAYSDLMEIYNQLNPKITWIFHGFNGNLTIAQQLIDKGCYLSAGPLLLKNTKLCNTISQIPFHHLFIETDVHPVSIQDMYHEVANLKNVDLDYLTHAIRLNFEKVFSIQL